MRQKQILISSRKLERRPSTPILSMIEPVARVAVLLALVPYPHPRYMCEHEAEELGGYY